MASLRWQGRALVLLSVVAVVTAACSGDSDPLADPVLTLLRASITVDGEVMNDGQAVASGAVVSAEGDGYGIVRLADRSELEVYKTGRFVAPNPTLSVQAPFEVKFEAGHMNLRLGDAKSATVVFGGARFTTDVAGTEFSLCYNPDEDAWCLYVHEGEGIWRNSGGTTRPLEAGKGVFASDLDSFPDDVRCAPEGAYTAWRDAARSGTETPSLPALVQTWPVGPCNSGSVATSAAPTTTSSSAAPTDETVADGVVLPAGRGMVEVAIDDPIIGTNDFATNSENYLESTPLEGPIRVFVDAAPVSNSELLLWIADEAGSDPDLWTTMAPQPWLNEALAGLPTRATYPAGENDMPAQGMRWQTAVDYCIAQGKHLATEVEWELAFANGYLSLPEGGTREWVSDWDAYSEGVETDQVVIRGNDNTREPDLYFRNMVVDSSASRRGTRIRCAAAEVAQEQPDQLLAGFGTLILEDDFLEVGVWPEQADEQFSLAYHDPDVYHLAAMTDHTQGAVVLAVAEPLDSVLFEAEVFVERARMGTADGGYRFGLVAGANDGALLIFTVQPNEIEQAHLWCISTVDDELAIALRDAPSG